MSLQLHVCNCWKTEIFVLALKRTAGEFLRKELDYIIFHFLIFSVVYNHFAETLWEMNYDPHYELLNISGVLLFYTIVKSVILSIYDFMPLGQLQSQFHGLDGFWYRIFKIGDCSFKYTMTLLYFCF